MKVLTTFQVQTERLSNLVLKMYNKQYLTLKVIYTQFLLTNLTCGINQNTQKHIYGLYILKYSTVNKKYCFMAIAIFVLLALTFKVSTYFSKYHENYTDKNRMEYQGYLLR